MFLKHERKDWCSGIPTYGIKDLMSKEEIYDFGLDVVYNSLVSENYLPINGNRNINGLPSLIFKKDEKLYFIVVEASIAPNKPSLNLIRKYNYLNYAKLYNAIPLYASISFGSTDEKRFKHEIALKGDSYYCDYSGLIEVKEDLKDKSSLEYNVYLLNMIGQSFKTKDYDSFLDLMVEDCSIYLDNHDNNKIDLTYVFNDFLDRYKNKEIHTSIIRSVDDIPYLFVGYENSDGKNSCEFSVTSNELGYITSITIEVIDSDKLVFE